ncbi:hypothetical protein HYT01_03975 [Candidatus Giovannonibacteria bacterium]|nr:hypothetical protein [Candidatus Giovannonibacteria bacterium]
MVKRVEKSKNILGRKTTRDEFTVVLEDLRSQFQAFGENLGSVHQKLDLHTSELDEIRTDMEHVRAELAVIRHNQVTRDEFKLLETRVTKLERANRLLRKGP